MSQGELKEDVLTALRHTYRRRADRTSSPARATATQTLDTLLSNILSHPTEEKYRSFKSENPRLQRSVLSVPGGTDYLLQAGFGTRTVEFKQQWYLHSSVQPSSTSSEASSTSASATTSASPSPSTSASSANSAQKWRRLQLAHRVLQERLGESEDRAVQKREQARREADVEKNRAARVLQEAQEDRERVALRAQRERLARARGQEEPRGGAAAGPSAVTGSRSGAVYQQPPPGTRPEYRVNTSTHVGAESPRNLESSGEPGAVIDRSDYTAEVPFDDPSNRGDEAELDEEDEQGDKPPPYGREEWGSGRRLGS